MTLPARVMARLTSPPRAEPACRTTPRTPGAAPERSAMVSEVRDLRRMVRSREAQLMRYTVWITAASTLEAASVSRNSTASSSVYSRARHARGLWLKNWIASAPRSTPRSTARAGPPAGETWAPTSIGRAPYPRHARLALLTVPDPLRVRFAPSPTGPLHIGGARTALYNWLLARGQNGTLLLRIEDTDRERSTPENVDQILDALRWLELDWDEGPISQAEQADRHREALDQLVQAGAAYRDPATGEDVAAWKEQHDNRGYRGEPSDEENAAVRL